VEVWIMKTKNKKADKSDKKPPSEAVAPVETWPPVTWPSLSRWFDTAFSTEDAMKVEEFRDGDALVVRAELPGIDPDKDVDVTVSNGMLRIHGERREETRSDDKEGHRSEFRYGAFTRVLPLPAGAGEADVKATYTGGILEVRVPVDPERAAAKKVQVTST
jgi:HSP20 family protein